jgi:hypothetical protein
MVVNAFYCGQPKLLPIPIFERSSFIEVPLELECTTPDFVYSRNQTHISRISTPS